MSDAFNSHGDYMKARSQWLSGLVNLGRHTLTGALCTAGRTQQDWSSDYRLLQRMPVDALFGRIQQHSLEASAANGPWVVAMDDSITRKTGRQIPGCGWRRDPLSPPFNLNMIWGQRVLQFSAAIPASDGSARLIPVDWQEAPLPKKPGKKAGETEHKTYAEARKQANLNTVAATRMAHLRTATKRPIHWVGDGRFTNRTVLRKLPANSVLIGRVRKDSKLYAPCEAVPGKKGRPRRYGKTMPTPEALRTDANEPWIKVSAWAAGQRHDFKIKTMGPVLARISGVDTTVRIVVIAPLGYRLKKDGRILYRQPACLICTDAGLPLETILQEYLWRWDIEVNFRDEKSLLGVSQAQVRNPRAVRSQPAAAVAAYSLLLLAAHKTYGHNQVPPSIPLPKWRRHKPPIRPTTGLLINQLRYELWSPSLRPESLSHFTSGNHPQHNPLKLDPQLASAVFHSFS